MNPQDSARNWKIFIHKQYYLPPWQTDSSEHDWSVIPHELLSVLMDFENAFSDVFEEESNHNISLESINELIISAYRRGQLEGW